MPNRCTDAMLDVLHGIGVLAARCVMLGVTATSGYVARERGALRKRRRNRRIHNCNRNWCRCSYVDWYWNQFE